MKNFTILLSTILFLNFSYSQKTELADSVSIAQTNQKEFIIRCQASISQSKEPLFVIDGVPMPAGGKDFENLKPDDIKSIQILKDTSIFSCYSADTFNDVILISTKEDSPIIKSKEYPFKTYKICNNNWNLTQDIYNTIQAKVPNVLITKAADLNAIPKISMRGDDNTIVIVDGVRFDASILNMLNPADIESITVAPSVAASNYLRNR